MGLAIAASTNARYENYEYSSCGTSHGAMKSTGTRISIEFGARQLHSSQG